MIRRSIGCALVAIAASAACSGGDTATPPELLPIAPARVAVNDTLRLALGVKNPGGEALSFSWAGPDLPGLQRVAALSATPEGAEFRWTPLASHVGVHELTFTASWGGGSSEQRAIVTVTSASSAGPVFLSPGSGGTYDLARNPCVELHLEVRDDDSASVTLAMSGAVPDGATFEATGPKSGDFRWCPQPAQAEESLRWTVTFTADDSEHPPTPHGYVIILRPRGASASCAGTPPSVTLTAPVGDARVRATGGGWSLTVRVEDDLGVREPPVVYWSRELPGDTEGELDVTTLAQLECAGGEGGVWHARLPASASGIEPGETGFVWWLAEAVDNDDPGGTACDHRGQSMLERFQAERPAGDGGGDAARCDPCTASKDCTSGVCAPSTSGGRCLDACGAGGACGGALACGSLTSVEGQGAQACGVPDSVCGGAVACTNDAFEPNDSLRQARALDGAQVMGVICPEEVDFFELEAAADTRIELTLDGFTSSAGDLDLFLFDPDGAIVAASAASSGREQLSLCSDSATTLYPRVSGFGRATSAYTLHAATTRQVCCVQDAEEPDDFPARAQPLDAQQGFDGFICPGDVDYFRFDAGDLAHVEVTLYSDPAVGDLELELRGEDGEIVAWSRTREELEHIDVDLPGQGRYYARVSGARGAVGEYVGEVTLSAAHGCESSLECPSGSVCIVIIGRCAQVECSLGQPQDCPQPGLCLGATAETDGRCALACEANGDCRENEACKWLVEGRACGVRGPGAAGASCVTDADCNGQRGCADWSDGYCARLGCTSNADCEAGTFCLERDGLGVCAVSCEAGDTVCGLRGGYRCQDTADLAGAARRGCLPVP